MEPLPKTAELPQAEHQFSGLTAHDECARGECALTHLALGRGSLAQGRIDGLLAHLERAIAIGSEDPAIYLEIAKIYDTLGLPRSAARIHEQIAEKFAEGAVVVAQSRMSVGRGAD